MSFRSISNVWQIFSIDGGVSHWLIVKNTPIYINTGFCCSKQYIISHTNYSGLEFVAREHLLKFICDGFHMKDFFWWGLEKHDPSIWEIITLFGRYSHHETAWHILNIYQCFFSPPPSGGFFQIFLASYSWMILHPLWDLSVWVVHCFLHSDIFLYSHLMWCGQKQLGVMFILFCFTFIIPSFPMLC